MATSYSHSEVMITHPGYLKKLAKDQHLRLNLMSEINSLDLLQEGRFDSLR